MRHLGSKCAPTSLILGVLLLAASSCRHGALVECEVSGHVVTAGQQTPLPSQSVEVWAFELPTVPIAIGRYVKVASTTTDSSGAFRVTARVSVDEMFELRTRNAGTVLGGGAWYG